MHQLLLESLAFPKDRVARIAHSNPVIDYVSFQRIKPICKFLFTQYIWFWKCLYGKFIHLTKLFFIYFFIFCRVGDSLKLFTSQESSFQSHNVERIGWQENLIGRVSTPCHFFNPVSGRTMRRVISHLRRNLLFLYTFKKIKKCTSCFIFYIMSLLKIMINLFFSLLCQTFTFYICWLVKS